MRHTSPFALMAAAIALAACTAPTKTDQTMQLAAKTPNPLLAPWTGPYGGVPPFDLASVSLLEPALEAAMASELAEIDARITSYNVCYTKLLRSVCTMRS